MLKDLVKQAIQKYDMIQQGERVLCALSGGADSVALFLCLEELQIELGFTLYACHFNHNLRGAESQRDENFVRELCHRHQILCITEKGHVADYCRVQSLSIETGARRLRYDFFERTAEKTQADKIATAHHAGDNLETMIYHLVRGTGPDGLGGIPPVRGRIIRPLILTERTEILAYLKEKGQPFVTDSTNESDDYVRNRIRHHILPVLKEINPQAEKNAVRCAMLLRQEIEFLTEQTRILEKQLILYEKDSMILKPEFWQTPAVLQRRLIRFILQEKFSLSPEQHHVESILELKEKGPSASLNLPNGVRAYRMYEKLCFEKGKTVANLETIYLKVPQELILENSIKLSLSITEEITQFNNLFNIFYVSCDRIDFSTLCVRSRKIGDRIRLPGHKVHKTLKKLYMEKKIPRHLRQTIPIIADKNGVICIYSLGYAADRKTKSSKFLKIKFEES